jgi:hypothetical protein
MQRDHNGCSTCLPGTEQWETFISHTIRQRLMQYEYRTLDGRLFSCVAPSLDTARQRRDAWLAALQDARSPGPRSLGRRDDAGASSRSNTTPSSPLPPRPGACMAYRDDGRVCGQPATTLDHARGGFVCDKHRPQPHRR